MASFLGAGVCEALGHGVGPGSEVVEEERVDADAPRTPPPPTAPAPPALFTLILSLLLLSLRLLQSVVVVFHVRLGLCAPPPRDLIDAPTHTHAHTHEGRGTKLYTI